MFKVFKNKLFLELINYFLSNHIRCFFAINYKFDMLCILIL